MTGRAGQTLTWDVGNRLTAAGGSSYVYGLPRTRYGDGDGFRVKKVEGGVTTYYINKYYQKTGVNGIVRYYYLGDKLAAYHDANEGLMLFVHQDHLTGTSLTTESYYGTVTGSIKYKPYGETRSSSGSLPAQKFTGQRLDDVGLYYYGARYYDPGLGRFISPDTLVQSASKVPEPYMPLTVSYSSTRVLADWNQIQAGSRPGGPRGVTSPQTLNRYTYAGDSPLVYVDDSGHLMWITAAIGAAVGLTYYAITNRDNFTWQGALTYTVGGAIIGATFGAGAELFFGGSLLRATYITMTSSPWVLKAFERGNQIEDALGRNLVRNFPTIDKWQNGIATSIKSLDLLAKTYENIGNLFTTVRGYIESVATFNQARWAGVVISPDQIQGRVLELAIPPGATSAQAEALNQLIEEARQAGVELKIVVVQ